MFESIMKFFRKIKKSEKEDSKNTAKERLHLVLAQDRANISADFFLFSESLSHRSNYTADIFLNKDT